MHWGTGALNETIGTSVGMLQASIKTQNPLHIPVHPQEMTVRVVSTPPQMQLVPHYGYVSLFPVLMRILPADSPRLEQQLNMLKRKDLLWSEFGLRWAWTSVKLIV